MQTEATVEEAAAPATSRRSPRLGVIAGVVLSVVILGALLAALDWQLFLSEMKRVRLWYIPPLFALTVLSYYIRAVRWRFLLPSGVHFQTLKLFNACIVGMLATVLLPLRAGEFVRPWALSRWQHVSFPLAFASIVTERVFDVLAMLVLLGMYLTQLPEAPAMVTAGAQALGVLTGAILLVMLIAYFRPAWLLQCLDAALARTLSSRHDALREKIRALALEFVQGLRAISSFTELAVVIFWSLVLWFEVALTYQVGLWCFGDFPSFWVGVGLTVFIALAIAVPSAPGFVGTFQLGCVAALTLSGSTREFALAYSIVLHSLHIIFSVVLGFIVLHYEGLRFTELAKRAA